MKCVTVHAYANGMTAESICPHCGSDKTAAILYGMPAPEAVEQAQRGEIVLAGCVVSDHDPERACRECASLWSSSQDGTTTDISKKFAEYFANWSIELPPGAEDAKDRGTIFKAGWTINYLFGQDSENYIEFYATHRMTSDRRHRIYELGRVESLDAIQEMYMYDSKVPGSEEESKRRYLEHNQHVAQELRELRLYPEGDINVFLRTNDVPPPRS